MAVVPWLDRCTRTTSWMRSPCSSSPWSSARERRPAVRPDTRPRV